MAVDLQPSIGLKGAIEQHGTTCAFRPDPIPEVLLAEIFRLGTRAPSGYNLQPWRFIVLRELESRNALKATISDPQDICDAPVILVCCGDRHAASQENIEAVMQLEKDAEVMVRTTTKAMQEKILPFIENHPSFGSMETWTNRHTMLAVACLMIAAKGFGIETCLLENFNASEVKAKFQIPDHLDICCLLAMGYSPNPFQRQGGWFAMETVFFGESYGNPIVL